MSQIELINASQNIHDQWFELKQHIKFFINRYIYNLPIEVLIPEEVDDINDEDEEDDNESVLSNDNVTVLSDETDVESEDESDDESEDESDDESQIAQIQSRPRPYNYDFGCSSYWIRTDEDLEKLEDGDDDIFDLLMPQGNE